MRNVVQEMIHRINLVNIRNGNGYLCQYEEMVFVNDTFSLLSRPDIQTIIYGNIESVTYFIIWLRTEMKKKNNADKITFSFRNSFNIFWLTNSN